MTGIIEDGTEDVVYRDIFNRFIIPAADTKTPPGEAITELKAKLSTALTEIKANKTAYGPKTEPRMLPSVTPKESHMEFRHSRP
jgi:hypothetical protein